MAKIKSSQLINSPLPKNAIITKSRGGIVKVERRWIAKKGFWAIVTTRGRDREIVPMTLKDGSIDRRAPKKASDRSGRGCPVCGCDYNNFTHERCTR